MVHNQNLYRLELDLVDPVLIRLTSPVHKKDFGLQFGTCKPSKKRNAVYQSLFCKNRPDPFPGPALFLCLFCVIVSFDLLVHVCFCCDVYHSNLAQKNLACDMTCFCVDGHKTLTQLIV